MTDYLYSYSLTIQTRLFLQSLGFGFLAGGLYDIFRAVRLCFGSPKWAYRLTDILYLITLAFFNFLFFLSCNEGEIRMFALFGEMLGFIIYVFSVGSAFLKGFEKIIGVIRRILSAAVGVISFPFRKLLGFIRKIVKKHLKNRPKSENKLKYPLKLNRHLLYNLINRDQKAESQDEGSKENAE